MTCKFTSGAEAGHTAIYLENDLIRITVLPELRQLEIVTSEWLHVDDLHELVATPMLQSVRDLRFRYDPCELHGVLPFLDELALDRLELVRDNRMRLVLARDELRSGKLQLVLREALDASNDLLAMLTKLDAEQLSSVHVSITYGLPSQRDEVDARLRDALSGQTRLTSLAVHLYGR